MSKEATIRTLAAALGDAGLIPSHKEYPALLPPDHRLLERLHSLSKSSSSLANLAVEPLLDEAMMLLNRCITARQVKQDLEAVAVTTFLSNKWFYESKVLRQKLVEIGEYSLLGDLAEIDVNTLGEAVKEANSAASIAKINVNERQDDHVDTAERMRLMAELNNITAPIPSPEIVKTSSRLSAILANLERYSVAAGWRQMESSSRLLEGAKATAERKLQFERVAGTLRKSIFDSETEYRDKLAALAEEPGSPLNHRERLTQLQEMFDVDIIAAYTRLKALEAGARVLYEYEVAVPDLLDEGALSGLVVWARRFAEHIAPYHERTQVCTIYISLRSNFTDEEWRTVLLRGTVTRAVGADLWPENARLIRFRQIGVAIDSDHRNIKMGLTVQLPSLAIFQTLSGGGRQFDYGYVPRLYLGDVSVPSDPTEFGKAASRTTYNASPLGDWKFDFKSAAASPDAIKDVIIGITSAVILE